MKTIACKYLVIGGGPAGATAARYLADSGNDTILLDKDFSYVKPCGGGMPSTAFDELELPHSAITKKISSIKVVAPSGAEAVIKLTDGHMCIVKRGVFDSLLRQEAKKAGARLIEARFDRFEDSSDKLSAIAESDEGHMKIDAERVISADGVNSRVRHALGYKPVDSIYTLSARIERADSEYAEFAFGANSLSGAYSWVFPHGDYLSVGTGCDKASGLQESLATYMNKRGLQTENTKFRGYRIPLWGEGLFQTKDRRVLFVGDSAGHVMPFTFEGLYYGMKSAQILAECIIDGKQNEYKKRWKSRFGSRFFFMSKVWGLLSGNAGLVERAVSAFQKPDVADSAQRLWLDKKSGRGKLISFIRIFGKMLR